MKEVKISWILFGRQSNIPDNFSTPTNFRFCRFYYVIDGECIYKDKNETITLEKGYVYLLPQNSYSLRYGKHKRFSHIWGHFQIDGWEFDKVVKLDLINDPIGHQFHNLIDTLSLNYFVNPGLHSALDMTTIFQDSKHFATIESTFTAFFNYLFQTYIDKEQQVQPFDAIVAYINNNLSTDLSNDTLANIMKYSRTHFIQEFTKHYKIPPQKYVLKARISRAIVLLMNDEKLYNISYKVGYDNPKSFARAFKRETGYSPQEYKNLHYYSIH